MVTVTLLVLSGIAVRVFALWEEPSTTGLALLLTLAAAGLTALGGTIGGSLVFDYGFDVEAGDHPARHRSERDVLPGHKHEADQTLDLNGQEPANEPEAARRS